MKPDFGKMPKEFLKKKAPKVAVCSRGHPATLLALQYAGIGQLWGMTVLNHVNYSIPKFESLHFVDSGLFFSFGNTADMVRRTNDGVVDELLVLKPDIFNFKYLKIQIIIM